MTDLVDLAWRILSEHVGHRNPITSANLSRSLAVGDDQKGTRETRALIVEVIRRGLPVAASEEGYFVLDNDQELESYITDLQDRIAGIQQRGQLVNRAFQNWRKNDSHPPPIHWEPEGVERV